MPVPVPVPATGKERVAPAAESRHSSSYHDIFERPLDSDDEEAEAAPVPPAPTRPTETELDLYLKLPTLPLKMPDGKVADILSWWKLHDHSLPAVPVSGRPQGLPCLARMARQYHGEPGSSAGTERLFSAASHAHHDLKASMGDTSLEHQLLALANTD